MEIKIEIKKNKYGSLFAVIDYQLFQFEYRDKKWYFWIRGDYDPEIFEQKDFPMKFFLDACRAKYFIKYGGELPDKASIEKGLEHIEKFIKRK